MLAHLSPSTFGQFKSAVASDTIPSDPIPHEINLINISIDLVGSM